MDSQAESLQFVTLFPGDLDGELKPSVSITKQLNIVEVIATDDILNPPSTVPSHTELPPVPQLKHLNGRLQPMGCDKKSIAVVENNENRKSNVSLKRKRESQLDTSTSSITEDKKKSAKAKKSRKKKKSKIK